MELWRLPPVTGRASADHCRENVRELVLGDAEKDCDRLHLGDRHEAVRVRGMNHGRVARYRPRQGRRVLAPGSPGVVSICAMSFNSDILPA